MAKESAGQRWGGYALESRPYESTAGDKWTGSLLNQVICRIIYWFSGLSYFFIILYHSIATSGGTHWWMGCLDLCSDRGGLPKNVVYITHSRVLGIKYIQGHIDLCFIMCLFFNLPLTFLNICRALIFLRESSCRCLEVVKKLVEDIGCKPSSALNPYTT